MRMSEKASERWKGRERNKSNGKENDPRPTKKNKTQQTPTENRPAMSSSLFFSLSPPQVIEAVPRRAARVCQPPPPPARAHRRQESVPDMARLGILGREIPYRPRSHPANTCTRPPGSLSIFKDGVLARRSPHSSKCVCC